MIPAPFSYQRPASLDEALGAIAGGGDVKVLAGGQSLLPLLKLRLASAGTLVDIGRIAELRGIRPQADGGLEIGALTTYAELLDVDEARRSPSRRSRTSATSRSATAGHSAGPSPTPTRPATCRPSASPSTTRSSFAPSVASASSRSTGSSRAPSMTAMEPDELLVAIRRGPLPAGMGGAYLKLAQPASGYSIVGVAAVVARSGGSVSHVRVAITGVGDVAYRAKAVEVGPGRQRRVARRRGRGGRPRRTG